MVTWEHNYFKCIYNYEGDDNVTYIIGRRLKWDGETIKKFNVCSVMAF
jgi:hypothetical protein